MKSTRIFLMAMLVLTASAHAGDRDKAGNGGGIAEQNFAFAATNMATYLSTCKGNPACGLSGEESALLDAILDELKSRPVRLEFKSESDAPGFFQVGTKDARAAKTGLERGSVIFINSDLIYGKDENGKAAPTTLMAAVSLLAHELGHHQGVRNETKLDLFGAKIRMYLAKRIYESETQWGHSILVLFLGYGSGSWEPKGISRVQILAQDSDGYHDLTHAVTQAVIGANPCSVWQREAGGLPLRLVDFNLENIHRLRYDGRDEYSDKIRWSDFQSDIYFRCVDSNGIGYGDSWRFQLKFKLKYDVKIKSGELAPYWAKLSGTSLFGLIRCSEKNDGNAFGACH